MTVDRTEGAAVDRYRLEYGSWSGNPMIMRGDDLVAYVNGREDWERFTAAIKAGRSERAALSRCNLAMEPW